GPVAATLLRVSYWFEPDGAFTGAALVATVPPSFQVLSGTWRLSGDQLELGEGAPPARLESAPGLLRLTGEQGVVVLEEESL
ncbi:MAG TPA: hypothetical protein VJP77_06025, partial [Planctomycetota bacterium]|nr:hypothetical protein [Planctomycetota bacterium]